MNIGHQRYFVFVLKIEGARQKVLDLNSVCSKSDAVIDWVV